MKTKFCNKCKQEKLIIEFWKNKNEKDGFHSFCKVCTTAYQRQSYKKNRTKILARNLKWRQENKKNFYLNRKCRVAGITTKQYSEMFRKQSGKCAICGITPLELNKDLRIDHNHETKEVRGLLCDNCNLLLGHGKNSPNILKNAINYLDRK